MTDNNNVKHSLRADPEIMGQDVASATPTIVDLGL